MRTIWGKYTDKCLHLNSFPMHILLHRWRGRSQQAPVFIQVCPGCQVLTSPLLLWLFLVLECTCLCLSWKKFKKRPVGCVNTEKWRTGGDTLVLRKKERVRTMLYLVWQDIHLQIWKEALISSPGYLQILDKWYLMYKIQKISGK